MSKQLDLAKDFNHNQAEYNFDFFLMLNENYPNDYHDWKINALFHIVYHLTLTLLNQKGYTSSNFTQLTHSSVSELIRPKFDKDNFSRYKRLYRISCDARYGGFLDLAGYKLHTKQELGFAIIEFRKICYYIYKKHNIQFHFFDKTQSFIN